MGLAVPTQPYPDTETQAFMKSWPTSCRSGRPADQLVRPRQRFFIEADGVPETRGYRDDQLITRGFAHTSGPTWLTRRSVFGHF